MKKIISITGGLLFLLIFESCTKDQPVTNTSKNPPAQQEQSGSNQSQTPEHPDPPSSCPHAAGHNSQG